MDFGSSAISEISALPAFGVRNRGHVQSPLPVREETPRPFSCLAVALLAFFSLPAVYCEETQQGCWSPSAR
jgi:hypothetical protein